jgi:hypothetical protein
MTITNVSTDDLFDGTFQQKILVADDCIFMISVNFILKKSVRQQ